MSETRRKNLESALHEGQRRIIKLLEDASRDGKEVRVRFSGMRHRPMIFISGVARG